MALINCSECESEVSDKAETCPRCGNPISERKGPAQVSTIQETSKKLKLQSAISSIIVIVAFLWIFVIFSSPDFPQVDDNSGIASLLLGAGLLWFIVTRVRIWWNHK